MKRYSLLIFSFIISIVLFIILIYSEKKINNQEDLKSIYIVKEDIKEYSSISLEELNKVFVKENDLQNYKFVTDFSELENKSLKKRINKGEILKKDDLIDSNEIGNYINESEYENISIQLENTNNAYSHLLSGKSKINLYVTIDRKYISKDSGYYINDILKDNEKVTFLYLEKVLPISYLDEKGKELNGENMLSKIILKLNKEQSMYLNTIKNVAKFNITFM